MRTVIGRDQCTDIAHDELQGTADGGVGAIALAQRVDAAIHADGPGDGSVNDDQRSGEMCGAEQPVQHEHRIEGCLEHAQHDWHVLRLAARHHGVDGHLLDRARREVGRNAAHDLVRLSVGATQHAQDAVVGRRHDGKAIAPAALEAGFDGIVPFADGDGTCLETSIAIARDQRLVDAGLDTLGAAAWLPCRQPVARGGRSGEPDPLGAIPTHGALDLAAAFEADQGRHGLDVETEGTFEFVVVDHPANAGRKRRVVLADDGQRAGTIQALHHRLDQHARRAVALGDDDEAVTRQRVGRQTVRH